MSTTQGSDETKKSVRFAAATTVSVVDRNADATNVHLASRQSKKRKLDKTVDRRNEDELDDVDEWNPDDENGDEDNNDDTNVKYQSVSDRDLRKAKSQRRIKRVVGDNDDDDEVDTTTRVDNRTSLAAEGYEVEPFNMDQEKNDGSGYFDGDTYVFRKRNDDDDEPDAWVDSLNDESTNTSGGQTSTDAAMRHDRIAMQREELRRKQLADDMDDRMDDWSEEDLYTKLLPHLEGNETIMGALVRYGQRFKVKNNANKNNSSKVDAANTSNDAERRQIAQDSFNTITEAANALLLKGKIDIYDAKRIDIEAIIKSKLPPGTANTTETSDVVSSNGGNNAGTTTVQWEYQGNQDGAIHGPYSTEEMLGWLNAGYFVGPMAVQVRTIKAHPPTSKLPRPEQSLQEDLLSDLFNDDENDTAIVPTPEQPTVQRGEWILSDKIDFHRYI